jgi:hypothetical protein
LALESVTSFGVGAVARLMEGASSETQALQRDIVIAQGPQLSVVELGRTGDALRARKFSIRNLMSANNLILGLGGSGRKIIRSFRKAIYQEFRKENPTGVNIGYLYIDSSEERIKQQQRS